jgi:cellulose synthase operon protein C
VEELGIRLEFCTRTGNEARGLEIIDHNLGLLDRSPNPRAEMNFAAAAASLLARVRGDLSVRGRPAASLGAEMERRAREIATRFDDRNATTEQTRQVAGRIAAEPFTDRLPLGVEGAGEPEGRGGAEGAGEPEDGG